MGASPLARESEAGDEDNPRRFTPGKRPSELPGRPPRRLLLAEGLQRREERKKSGIELPRFSMGRPRVNLGDRNALEGLMDS